jgi:mannose-6-phosphate isomerase
LGTPNPRPVKPFRLQPLPVVRVWGGRRLAEELRRGSSTEPLGESWEVHGSLTVAGGEYSGGTLDEVCAAHSAALLGERFHAATSFPLLLKWLDCQDWLSLQVHPDDEAARALESNPGERGKTEAWYFWRVDPDAEVIHGWKNGTPSGEELRRLQGSEWLGKVRRVKPQAGEWMYTPAGTVHALGPGLLVFEVQQSSDLTYRLYDWDRLGLDGKPREMHLDKGVSAIASSRAAPLTSTPPGVLGEVKVLSPYFCVEQFAGSHEWSPAGLSVELLTSLADGVKVEAEGDIHALNAGDTLIVPASTGQVRWIAPPDVCSIRVRLTGEGIMPGIG